MIETVLLVDDEPGIRKILGIWLADAGYRVIEAESGDEALRMFAEFHPAIVLTDIKMPGMDGIDLLQAIKRANPDTEVIMITGHGDLDLAIKSLKYEATDFITKPIGDEAMEVALKRTRERMQMRRQLQQYTENLEVLVAEKTRRLIEAERMAAVGETVAGLSHTIKNIASGLKGGAFVLEQGIETRNAEYLNKGWTLVKGNVDKITKLSMDLLNFAKSDRIRCRWCDPAGPAREVVALMQQQAAEYRVALRLKIAPDLPACFLDPDGLHRCLLNLVVNALEACHEAYSGRIGGTVVIRVDAGSNQAVEYGVSDNGCGMTAEVKNRVFQRFFTTKGTRGTGVGLMMTRRIVNRHCGEIRVESAPGKGSRFVIHIPHRASAQAPVS